MSRDNLHPTPDRLLHLHRCDLARNMARFYRLSIERDLFGGVIVLREWGRIGTRGQRLTEPCLHELDAQLRLLRLAQAKRRRGYVDIDA
ncbi:WGR domain-containing protein [Rhizobium sp. RU36D]|uniref:WGR domain-containing protein n=1 Tax=Rhizobium sp. RU36D TaxID=1907415 RepID=UPI0009D858E8|nr:WGR domain-containing protein [Rhizobium sp. RU36D]SMD00147.1 WGR domain-containing protein, predicted DNA-binding domain in MolR [Rhizobium sp. RU36D]